MTRRLLLAIAAAACLASIAVAADVPPTAEPAAAQTTPVTNPPIPDQCGLPMTLILDASGSISSANAVEDVRDAAEIFLDAIKDTGSTARVIDFGTFSRETAPAVLVTTQSMGKGGVHTQALAAYYNPKPPVTSPATAARQYDGGGSITSPDNFGGVNNESREWTNWDSALARARTAPGELVVFITDGDPTALDLNHPGDAFNPPGTTVAFNTFRSDLRLPSVDRAVQESNAIKTAGTRVLAVGVGAAVTQPQSVARLVQVAGPKVVETGDPITDINQVDVAVVRDFDDLADALRLLVTELCSPSLSIRKFVQTAESTNYVPGPNWSVTATPTVTGGTFDWILPDTTPATSKTVLTDPNGFARFQWEPDPPTASSTATVSEVVQAGLTPGPARCEIFGPEGPAEFVDFESSASFQIGLGPQDIVTCALFNNFNYAPGIALTKTPAPTVVRGDDGSGTVVFTYAVTNTGNTPLVLTDSDDTNCHDLEFTGGDDGDGRLDTTETWTYTCSRLFEESVTEEEILVPNTATVNGRDPAGTLVTATADAQVKVLTPRINLEKEVAGATEVAPGTPVTYTFTVTNLGNEPLSSITLTDSNCTPTFVSGDTDDDLLLDLAETWTFTCTAVPISDPTINEAKVTGTPSIGANVEDLAEAKVEVIYEDLQLLKSVTDNVVFTGDDVTYTYVLTNIGEDPLAPPTGLTAATAVTDPDCTPVFQGGDVGADNILSGGESWIYTCIVAITDRVLNTATATMEGALGPLTRVNSALVVPLTPGITIVKTPSDDIVRAGTDVTYTYDVSNTGQVALAGVTTGVVDDTCEPVTFVDGDTDGDTMLDVDEVFTYTCTVAISEATTNVATVTGTPTLPDGRTDEPISATDDAVVETFTSAISLEKAASEEVVRVGTPVTFTFVATNTGDSDLVPISLEDDQCNPVAFLGESASDDGVMQPGEQWSWDCTKPMIADATNTAVVTAVDIDGELVTDDATDQVLVFDSEIRLTKDADPVLVPEGGSTTFTFVATNPGTVPLTDVTVTDDTCSPVTFQGGDANGDGALAPNEEESWTFTCTRAITEITSNTATVVGTDPSGFQPTDSAVAGAVPYLPGIAVSKVALQTEVAAGESVTYRYEVVNTGNVPLADVAENITDDKCSPVTYVEGDLDENGLLTSAIQIFEISLEAEIWIFECTTIVTEDTVNVVTVSGVPSGPNAAVLGEAVSASATASVQVVGTVPIPTTGSQSGSLVGTGITLIAIGGALVLFAWYLRRRVDALAMERSTASGAD